MHESEVLTIPKKKSATEQQAACRGGHLFHVTIDFTDGTPSCLHVMPTGELERITFTPAEKEDEADVIGSEILFARQFIVLLLACKSVPKPTTRRREDEDGVDRHDRPGATQRVRTH